MAFAKARTALAAIEEKLRRQFGLAGEVGATLTPDIIPVVITGDLREAGNAANQGRAFQWCFTGTPGANGFFSLQPQADVRIDQVWASSSIAAQFDAWLSVPGQAPAVAVATLAGTWVDRKLIAGDQVPLTQGVFGALTGTNVSDQNRIVGTNIVAGARETWDLNIMVPATSTLNFRVVGAAAIAYIGLRGRIWP